MNMSNDIDIQMLLCALFYNENEPAAAADDNDIDYLITVGEEEPSINISTFGSIESIFAEDDDSLLSFDFEEEEEETMQNTEEETIHNNNIDSIFNDDVSANKDKGEGSASNKHQFIGRAVTFEEEEELADGNSGSGTAKSNLKEIWDNKWKQRYDDLVVSTL